VTYKELTELHNQRFVPSFNTKQFQDVLLSLTGLTGTFYDYIKANAGTLITGSTWNQVLHDGIYVGVASAVGVPLITALLQMLWQKQKQHQDWSLFCIPRQVWVTVSKHNPWLRVSRSNYKSFWDNYVTVSNADAKKYELLMKLLLMVD
jgi:molybdopterin-containing oxidoreductase family iron-sulfur binding subunit